MGMLNALTDRAASLFSKGVSRDAAPVVDASVQSTAAQLSDRLALAAHRDGALFASDGQAIAYRTTEVSGKPKAVFVMQQGTLGKPEYFDAMGEQLSQKGIKSYAVGSRTEAPSFHQHADDLQQVVAQAQKENPGVPVTVGGVSLGSMIALDWSARHNAAQLPVVAMAPVVANKFLGLKDSLRVGLGLIDKKAQKSLVDTPMSAGVPLTTNPASPEFALTGAKDLKVPAGLFDDVAKMAGDVALKGRSMQGPLLIAMGGKDQVAVNGVSKLYAHLIGSKAMTVKTFPGVAHDMSQETNHPELVQSLQNFILQQ
ncbi:MAG TPA: alpha/beta hydrolase [Oscillatoriaceae cyanobacterium]